jgi:vitamin B12 transporter
MHRSRLAAAALVLALAVPVSAQQPPESPGEVKLPEILVSATRIESTLATSPDAITVVTRAQIDDLRADSVAEVLETVPGVIVSRSGQPGAQTSVFLRGASSGQTLVLVDGVRVNNAFGGRFDFANLTVDNVERIEVVRGPQSTRYGSDALGGVINVVTRKSAAANAGSALVELGGNASVRTRAALSASLGSVSLSAEGEIFDTDNERPNSEYNTAGGSLGATWRAGERLEIAATGSYRDSEAGTPNDRFTNDPNDETRTETSLAALFVHGVPADWWDLRLSLSAGHERMRFSGPEPNPPYFSGDSKAETTGDSQQVDLQNVFTLAPGQRLFVGLSYDRMPTEYESEGPFGPAALDETLTATAVSAQYDWSPAKSFTASLGGRVDDFSSFGTHATWRAGGRYTVAASGTILRANVGTGFRAPTVADLYFPGSANPDLEPEESTGWDVGLEQPLAGGRLQLGATWFRNDFDNLIQWAPSAVGPWGGRMENVAEARTDGIEAFVQWLPAEGLSVSGSYTWLRTAEDKDSGDRLLRRPEHSGSVAAAYRFPRWVQVDTVLRFSGSSDDKNFTTFPAENVENDGFVKWDLGATVTPLPWLSLVARVENLLDEEYEEAYGFPALGRVFWGGATVRF